jgi:hypothetical protein
MSRHPSITRFEDTKMSRKILSLAGLYLLPRGPGGGVHCPEAGPDDGTVRVEDVRAVATEGALATAVDASPAVLVSLWEHDQRLHPRGRRSGSPRR